MINQEIKIMGKMSPGECWTAIIFHLTASGRIFRENLDFLFPDPKLITDATIAMAGA